MATKAAKALKSLKTLSADEIGSLKSVKASEMSTDIRCMNHAESVALRKQVDVWYQDQTDAVRKLSRGQQATFRKLIKVQNEKRRLQRRAYIQKHQAMQQKLREQAIKDREAAAMRGLQGTIKKGKKKLLQRQKDKLAATLENIPEKEETPHTNNITEAHTGEISQTDRSTYIKTGTGNDRDGITGEIEKKRDVLNADNVSKHWKHSRIDSESVDSGIAPSDISSVDSQPLPPLLAKVSTGSETKTTIPHENVTTDGDTKSTRPRETSVGRQERKVTFVEDEIGERHAPSGDRNQETPRFSESSDVSDKVKQIKISHHHVTVVDGETGKVEVLPREKTRIVDEGVLLDGMPSKSKKYPAIKPAYYLRPSTSDEVSNTNDDDDVDTKAVAMTTGVDPESDRPAHIITATTTTQESHSVTTEDAAASHNDARLLNSDSLLPPIRDAASDHTRQQTDETKDGDKIYLATSSYGDGAESKSSESGAGNTEDISNQSPEESGSREGQVRAGGDDDNGGNDSKARKEMMRERNNKLDEDFHKYHIGIANRTFRIPNYEVPRVSRVPVYNRNSEGSLVASEKTVRPAAEDFKLPSRRQEYIIKKALEYEESRKEIRERKLREFLGKMKNLEHGLSTNNGLASKSLPINRGEPFRTYKREDISHNTLQSTVFGQALATNSKYGEFGDANDLRNCRYIRQPSLSDTSSSVDETYEGRRRRRALDKVSSWGPLGLPHGASSRTKKRKNKPFVSI